MREGELLILLHFAVCKFKFRHDKKFMILCLWWNEMFILSTSMSSTGNNCNIFAILITNFSLSMVYVKIYIIKIYIVYKL